MSADAVLTTHNLTIGYRKRVVAENLSLELRAGELVCLLGPNGAGKSTLLRTLAGMQPPLSGYALLQDDDVSKLSAREIAKRLSIVLTERVDAGTITARELVALGRYPYTDWMNRQTDADRHAVEQAIRAVGATTLADRHVHELSDGERQKIMIARALAQEPVVMMLDEPTAFLDLPRRVEILYLLRSLARETRRAILLSTHDLDLALRCADQVWLMTQEGRMHVGAPEDLVLSGAFGRAFASMGAHFDGESGTFAISAPSIGTVNLIGEGTTAQWTARALEREGFRLDPTSGVTVEVDGEQRRWKTIVGEHSVEHTSIYELMASLKAGVPERAP